MIVDIPACNTERNLLCGYITECKQPLSPSLVRHASEKRNQRDLEK